ncbi:unnamed protein product [Rotaria magnacalcarata]|uniref:G-protein coupled receptors family 1 profile domain-containing protein n=1 Tax=Rotaria magnacalcarata TaxID=392030 RepID=A0A814SZC9_9BILA|nr:unnamed protein product [Rotaria magnacalcarata]
MTDDNLTSLYINEYHSGDAQYETLGSLIFFTIVYVLVLISGLVGNFIVLYVILKNNDLKHFTNYFFANLSAADVFVLIFCIPTAIHDIWAKDQWYLGKFFCLSNQYIESCATSVSSLTITAISFERFIAICEPFKVHDIFNKTLTLVTIFLIWAIGLIFSLPFLIFSVYDSSFNPTDSLNNTTDLLTICQLNANSSAARACITWFIVLLIFIPFFVLIFIYARIILELARHRATRLTAIAKTRQQQQSYEDETNSLNGVSSSNNDNQQSHSFLAYKRFEQKRLNTVIICVVTVAFFACQFPVRVIQLVDMYGRVRNEDVMSYVAWIWLWKLSKLLFFLNFTANPIIYNILSTKFRRSCRRLFQIHRSRGLVSTPSRKTSITSYLYSSIYKSRRRQSSLHNSSLPNSQNKNNIYNPSRPITKKLSLTRSVIDSNQMISLMNNNNGKEQINIIESESRDLVTIGNNEEILFSTLTNNGRLSQKPFQVLTEEADENIVH